ncbi:EAL domain-containing protein [Xanthobacter agilis]|uniref:Diguanylate cyclase (GGDEF)-like protein/PAS domain S-box-containing protein n=1 Tax=Xanthobacter agilis TaxID=47492 RepID=A0ABU0LH09_XANAG|nr:EAL domain-containing protein [Xanthobacter agilis]MDQ0506372.1 diguanylate cyclase (GGDEF)-like protein/PAS domain S-box-containing protein [Xanthobacter agilis]
MRSFIAAILAFVLALALASLGSDPARALEPVALRLDAKVTNLAPAVERETTDNGRFQVSTAPDSEGVVRRIEVQSADGRQHVDWIAFALTNNTDEQVDRLIVAPHYRMVGSGLFWPDLGNRRIVSLTPSQGFKPERQNSPDADVFLVTLDPGSTVTFVAELGTSTLPQLYLWEPDAYKDRVNAFTLYHGIVIGIAGLLALFLTILFVVKGSVMFPAAAALAWAVLGYIGLDFAFWSKVFGLSPVAEQFWRAAGEAVLTATLLVFLFAYLNLNRWHVRYVHVAAGWLAFLAALVVVALLDAPVAAGIARLSLLAVAVFGFGIVLWLSQHGYDRAVLVIPTWSLLLVWVLMAGLTVAGTISNDLAAPALSGGLVLIVMLIGFTVMQHAFAGIGGIQGSTSELERRALALAGSGLIVWDWDVDTDRIYTSPEAEEALGLKRHSLETEAAGWLEVLHPADRDRFRATLDGIIDQRRGRIDQDFRLKAIDGHYLTFNLKARPVVGADGEVVRCVGTLFDVTGERIAAERLLHDAVRDNLTGLPNRELFLDRLEQALTLARIDPKVKPTVMVIDLDRFKQVNVQVGMAVADSILLTVSRRLMRLLRPQDTLARIAGDQFGLILLSERDPERITTFADTLRRSLRAPIALAEKEVFVTASIGLLLSGPEVGKRDEVMKDAELAMYYGKRIGGDRIEVFRPAMRQQKIDRVALEAELAEALNNGEIFVRYQPIVRLNDRAIGGFEAYMRWNHPRLGELAASEFLSLAEETGLILELGLHVLEMAAGQLAVWQRMLRVDPPLFVHVNVSSRQLLRHDLVQDLKSVLTRNQLAPGSLKLEITETLVMENPEYAAVLLSRVRELGAGLVLDNFGTGYSSLSYLQRFPFDTIKIDQHFVRDTAKGPARAARPVIINSLVELAHELGMDVIAEGLEREGEAAQMARYGCEYAQGVVFGEPLTAEDCRALIEPAPVDTKKKRAAAE